MDSGNTYTHTHTHTHTHTKAEKKEGKEWGRMQHYKSDDSLVLPSLLKKVRREAQSCCTCMSRTGLISRQ